MSDCSDCDCDCDCTGLDIGSGAGAGDADCCAGDDCDCNCCAGDGCDCNCTGRGGCCEGCDSNDCGNCISLMDCCNEGFSCWSFSSSSPANAPQVVAGDEQQQQQRKDLQMNFCCLCMILGTGFLGIAGVIVLIVLTVHSVLRMQLESAT